jgi:hypothetical protein
MVSNFTDSSSIDPYDYTARLAHIRGLFLLRYFYTPRAYNIYIYIYIRLAFTLNPTKWESEI